MSAVTAMLRPLPRALHVVVAVVAVGVALATGAVVFAPAAGRAQPPPADPAAGLAEEIGKVALPGWSVRRDGDVLRVSGAVVTHPAGAATAADVERNVYAVTVTVAPYVDDATQGERLASAQRAERALWATVARLQCRGKDFSDHYVDGLCFHTRTAGQERRVDAYRRAREALLDVPRHHLGAALSVSVRARGPEPTDGACDACGEMESRILKLLTPYPTKP